jgi:hypothetical protein
MTIPIVQKPQCFHLNPKHRSLLLGVIGDGQCGGLESETHAVEKPRLYWSQQDICNELGIEWRKYDRIYRKGVLPRPKIRIRRRGPYLYDQKQSEWLTRLFDLMKRPVGEFSSRRPYTLAETIRLLQVEEKEIRHHLDFDFVAQPVWVSSPGKLGLYFSSCQLGWLFEYFKLQESKEYDPIVNHVSLGEAHLWLGLSREKFESLVDENPTLRPMVSFIDKGGYYYHKDHLDAIRQSMMFGNYEAVA